MLGERLKKLREEKGLLQKDIAKLLNITASAYGFYEQGKRDPDTDVLRKLADFYGVSIDYLMGRTDIRNPALTKKDEKEIEKEIEAMKKKLLESEGLMLSGEPVSKEAIESILEALEYGMRQAKRINKKYTPKKYRKDNTGE